MTPFAGTPRTPAEKRAILNYLVAKGGGRDGYRLYESQNSELEITRALPAKPTKEKRNEHQD